MHLNNQKDMALRWSARLTKALVYKHRAPLEHTLRAIKSKPPFAQSQVRLED
jgi:hypothetical protein